LLWLCLIAALSLLMGQSLLTPVLVGWYRAEEAVRLQDELDRLQQRHAELRAQIEYRKTPAGQALTASEVLLMAPPGGIAIDLQARTPSATPTSRLTLEERATTWREKGRRTAYAKWRVLNLLVLDRWLPPERGT
jgi:hypothetical protein